MLILTWIIGLLAAFAAICAIPWLCVLMVRSLRQHWRSASPGPSAFNPLLELVQPRAHHVIETREQRLKLDEYGSPLDPPH